MSKEAKDQKMRSGATQVSGGAAAPQMRPSPVKGVTQTGAEIDEHGNITKTFSDGSIEVSQGGGGGGGGGGSTGGN